MLRALTSLLLFFIDVEAFIESELFIGALRTNISFALHSQNARKKAIFAIRTNITSVGLLFDVEYRDLFWIFFKNEILLEIIFVRNKKNSSKLLIGAELITNWLILATETSGHCKVSHEGCQRWIASFGKETCCHLKLIRLSGERRRWSRWNAFWRENRRVNVKRYDTHEPVDWPYTFIALFDKQLCAAKMDRCET